MPKKINFESLFMRSGESLAFLMFIIMYPFFWYFWLFAEDKSYTPNTLIKQRWKELTK